MNRLPKFSCQLGWLALPFFTACASAPPAAATFLPPDRAHGMPAPSTTTATPSTPVQGQSGKPKNHFDVMFGTSYWNDLGSLDTSTSVPAGGPLFGGVGDFDSWGWAFDFGYDRVVWSNHQVDWSVGIETGWSTFGSDSVGYSGYSDITASMWYVGPTTHWHFELSRQATLVAGLGAGYYGFAVEELTTYYYGWWWGYESRTLNQDDAFGGFASLGVDFEVSPSGAFRLENKLHFVDFGGLDSLLPNESSVSGPIWTIEIGYVLKF